VIIDSSALVSVLLAEIREARATIEPVNANQAALARQAYRDFVHTDLRSALA